MRILVSIPNMGWIHKHVFMVGLKLDGDPRHDVNIIIPTHNPYENNLHHIVKDFVGGEWDFWLNIDADNPPMRNPLDLVDLDKAVIGLPTPVWHYTAKEKERPLYWNAYDYVPEEDAYREHQDRDGLQKVDAVGSGCFLVARRVFENERMRRAPFQRTYYEDGTVHKGTDIAFCERARDQSFEIWCHYGYPCRHFNELELGEVVRAFRGLYE